VPPLRETGEPSPCLGVDWMGRRRIGLLLLVAMVVVLVLPTGSLAKDAGDKDETIQYLALGDSIAYGIGAVPPLTGYVYHYRDFLSRDARVELNNLAKPGLTSAGLLAQLDSLGEENADLVTVSIGGNNVLGCGKNNFQEIDGDCAAEGLKKLAVDWPKIIAKIRSLNPEAKIQVMNLYNPFAKSDPVYESANEIILQLNSLLSSGQLGEYSLVDVYSVFAGKERRYTYFYSLVRDVHPTGVGHVRIAKLHYRDFRK
jgi:lysophospholipase L1-like esterase